MATRTVVVDREAPRAAEMAQPVAGVAFTWIMVILCGWLLGGLYLDGWAHNHEKLDINATIFSRSFTRRTISAICLIVLFWVIALAARVLSGLPVTCGSSGLRSIAADVTGLAS